MKWVYIIATPTGQYKVGVASSPQDRLRQLQQASPAELKIVHVMASSHAGRLERRIHKKFRAKRVRGEWFNLSDEDIAQISRMKTSVTDKAFKSGPPKNGLIQVTGPYLELLRQVAKNNHRTPKVELQRAIERHAASEGVPIPPELGAAK